MSKILSANQTPFPVLVFDHAFHHGEIFHCAVMKSTFAIGKGGELKLLEAQPDLLWNDQYWDEDTLPQPSEQGSLYAPSDLLPYKPRVDVLLAGHAHAPDGLAVPAWAGELRINGRAKRLVFTGPRHWKHHFLGGWVLEETAPIDKIPLRYELAFGGSWPPLTPFSELKVGDYYPDNPTGRGFFCKNYKPDTRQTYLHPQILSIADFKATQRFQRDMDLCGFSALPGHFWSRLQKAGLYDDAWQRDHAPNIPLDMDLNFWNCAPQDQQIDDAELQQPATLTLGLTHLLREKEVTLRLPDLRPWARVDYASGDYDAYRMRLDTILIDLDSNLLSLRWHYRVSERDAAVSIRISAPGFAEAA